MPHLPTATSAAANWEREPDSETGTGMEWIVEAFDCEIERLRDLELVLRICDQIVADLGLNVLRQPLAHQFDEPGGVTALYMLSESHLACHTYPEYRLATFNLYCCSVRSPWDWADQLRRYLRANEVETRKVSRGLRAQHRRRIGLDRDDDSGDLT